MGCYVLVLLVYEDIFVNSIYGLSVGFVRRFFLVDWFWMSIGGSSILVIVVSFVILLFGSGWVW